MLKQKYERLDRKLGIVDVGCRWGFADEFLRNIDDVNITGFDPDAKECEELNKMYHHENIRALPYALGACNSVRERLYITEDPGSSSLYEPYEYRRREYPDMACNKIIGTKEIDVFTYPTIAEKHQLYPFIDYLKLDVQGSELNVLMGMKDYIPSIRVMKVEVEFNSMYSGQPLFPVVDTYLRRFGFELWGFSNMTHYGHKDENKIYLGKDTVRFDDGRDQEFRIYGGQLFWADALYVNLRVFDLKNSMEQLRRDAFLFDILGRMDIVERVEGIARSFK